MLYVRLDGGADISRTHACLTQGDGEVLGLVGLQERNFRGRF